MKESILFWPVRLEKDALLILDETLIPERVAYIRAGDYRAAIRAVVDMKTRAFGQFLTVCYTFMLEVRRSKNAGRQELMGHLGMVAGAFNKSRPTFPFEEVTGMILGMARKASESLYFADEFLQMMAGMLDGIRQQRYARAREAASLIKNGDGILTHCHVSGEMALVGEFCRRDKKKIRFFATETRPYFQGARLTAWELNREGFDVTLIADNATASVMADGLVDCVLVGSDRSAKNGDFANKVGTYQIALLAKHYRIPFYVLVQPSEKLASGRDIPVEIRPDDEVLMFRKRRLGPGGLDAYYPGFDVVPHSLVTQHIAIHGRS